MNEQEKLFRLRCYDRIFEAVAGAHADQLSDDEARTIRAEILSEFSSGLPDSARQLMLEAHDCWKRSDKVVALVELMGVAIAAMERVCEVAREAQVDKFEPNQEDDE